MRKNKSQLKAIVGAPPLPIKRTDTSALPSETYDGGQMADARWEWLRQFGRLRWSEPDLTSTELKNIEARVRKELYP